MSSFIISITTYNLRRGFAEERANVKIQAPEKSLLSKLDKHANLVGPGIGQRILLTEIEKIPQPLLTIGMARDGNSPFLKNKEIQFLNLGLDSLHNLKLTNILK